MRNVLNRWNGNENGRWNKDKVYNGKMTGDM
jgi:hypothetical protein